MTTEKHDADASHDLEPIHVFDQTNGVLKLDDAAENLPTRRGAAPGDLPSVTGLLLNGTN